MENPFILTKNQLTELLRNFIKWYNSNPKEAEYSVEMRQQAQKIRDEFLNEEVITKMPVDVLYPKVFEYSRSLEGPAYIKLGEQRIRSSLEALRRNLIYIITSKDSPFEIAQNILEGQYKIEVFAKAFWSPILQARFPEVLPNWNNKTEAFMKKVGVNLTTSKLSVAQKYQLLSNAFTFLSSLLEDQDFFDNNHLMHYGTVVGEGKEIINRMLNLTRDPVYELIKSYKKHITNSKLKDELYKWELVKKYHGKLDPGSPDFIQNIKTIDFGNLIYPIAITVKNHLAREVPDQYRDCFIDLFDDDTDVVIRVESFMENVEKVYRKIEPKMPHHHDERTIATFLAYHNPSMYPFFKDSFYQKYCKLLGIEAKPKGEKYEHYIELITELVNEYIIPDVELTDQVSELMNPDCFEDENHLILAQDILFKMLDKDEEKIEITDQKVFKISMGEFGEDDVRIAIEKNIVLVHKNTKAKGVSSVTQGDLFQSGIKEGDYFYLTHGNKGVKLLGIFTGEAKQVEGKQMGYEGWLERSFVEVYPAINMSAYTGKKKWWTPNENSTCIEIPRSELEEANKLIFKPYFNTAFDSIEIFKEPELPVITPKDKIGEELPLNTILYGPPGTGKTYHTVDLAVQIASPDNYSETDHEANKLVFEKLVQSGQIAFTTFHQSMNYEDFIEGIKPSSDDSTGLSYSVEDGIFKQLAINAAFEFVGEKSPEASKSLSFSFVYDKLLDEVTDKIGKDEGYLLKLKSGAEVEIIDITSASNFLVKHKNGTRTYTVSRRRLEKLFTELPDLETISNINEEIRKIIGGSNASAYWAVLKKLRSYKGETKLSIAGKNYSYEDKATAVGKLLPDDVTITGTEKVYVMIIDEINRGNVSQIFGELITLLEEDKRFGKKERLSTILPYSRSRFFVPPNLYIIGTMNTADRSVEALDTALRRRFSFIEMMPEYDLPGLDTELAGVRIKELLELLNNRIEKLIDRDHRIGHSYFLGLNSTEDLMRVFRNKVVPLFQEYFFGNYEKMGLVLGKGFIEKLPDEKVKFASFPADENDFNDRVIYRINKPVLDDPKEFEKAIAFLMNME